tara:strand:+ start:26734 stop:26964 length:231 start_codon:yes stop_codon:yes gene_type:complete
MQVKIKLTHNGADNPAPVEVHGADGFVAGWSADVMHFDHVGNRHIKIGVVDKMLDAAFEAGQQAKAKAIRKELQCS